MQEFKATTKQHFGTFPFVLHSTTTSN